MKRIAIFCDGTWNRSDAKTPTHVVRLAQALAPVAPDGVVQVPFYLPGVGSGQGVTMASRLTDKVLGGAFGLGLDARIAEAYRSLIFAYDPGDEIYIFGFSRGAYTARSLAGLIRSAGIPSSVDIGRIPEAMDAYRARGPDTHPDSEKSKRFRAGLSPDTPTSEEDADWRVAQGMAHRDPLKIAYLGVWDTVGALGLPGFLGLFARLVNEHYAFHDTELSRSVAAARHAVAIDERRRHFPPALWSNIDRLNRRADEDPDRAGAPYAQLWFPGNHGIVGGSGRVPELSAYPTDWIAKGAEAQGLRFRPDRLGAITALAKAGVDDKNARRSPALNNLYGWLLADRELPAEDATLVSDAARERALTMGWRPPTLASVMDELIEL